MRVILRYAVFSSTNTIPASFKPTRFRDARIDKQATRKEKWPRRRGPPTDCMVGIVMTVVSRRAERGIRVCGFLDQNLFGCV